MSDPEDLRKRILKARDDLRKGIMTDPEEILAAKMSNAVPSLRSFCLELLYDEATKTVLLQGNQFGLEKLLATIQSLANPGAVSGAHAHFDADSNLTRNNLNLIIQRVADDGGGGAHVIDKTIPEE